MPDASPALERFITRFQLQRPEPAVPQLPTRQAAVLVPIINRPRPALLLTRRAATLRYASMPGRSPSPAGCGIMKIGH